MTANPWRGEVEIILGNKPYVLRPTFSALSNIEQQLGVGLISLAQKLAEGIITLEELAVIITQCSLITPPDVQEALVNGGLTGAIQSISQIFAMVFGGYNEME